MSARGNLIANGYSATSRTVPKTRNYDGAPENLEPVHDYTIKSLRLRFEAVQQFVLVSEVEHLGRQGYPAWLYTYNR